MADVETLATEYMVSALPVTHREASRFAVWVQWRGAKWGEGTIDRYVVARHQNSSATEVWHARKREWVWESQPSSRTDGFMNATRYPLERALKLARQVAPSVTVNGWTPETVLARDAAREASGD